MGTNLLYGPVVPRRSASDPDPWPTELELHDIWSDLDALERDALRDIARAERLGFDPTIRDHSERSGDAFTFATNTFNKLGRRGLSRVVRQHSDPVDCHWALTGLGEAVYSQSSEA